MSAAIGLSTTLATNAIVEAKILIVPMPISQCFL